MTELVITHVAASDNLTTLLRWPHSLEILNLTSIYFEHFSDLAHLRSTLSVHEQTLRVLDLRFIEPNLDSSSSYDGDEPSVISFFDFRPFTALTHLTLDRVTITLVDHRFVHHLLAPNLRVFTWDLVYDDEMERNSNDLNEDEERWLCALARAVADIRNNPRDTDQNIALRLVNIEYAPYDICIASNQMYPWDRLERAEQVMNEAGIQLRWDEPTVSKEEYERRRKQLRESEHG